MSSTLCVCVQLSEELWSEELFMFGKTEDQVTLTSKSRGFMEA